MQTCCLTNCDNELTDENTYCIGNWLAMTGHSGVASHQCTQQHKACSLEHAVLAAKACIDEHLVPYAQGQAVEETYEVGAQ
jgi:hypothetical protein